MPVKPKKKVATRKKEKVSNKKPPTKDAKLKSEEGDRRCPPGTVFDPVTQTCV